MAGRLYRGKRVQNIFISFGCTTFKTSRYHTYLNITSLRLKVYTAMTMVVSFCGGNKILSNNLRISKPKDSMYGIFTYMNGLKIYGFHVPRASRTHKFVGFFFQKLGFSSISWKNPVSAKKDGFHLRRTHI